MSLLVIAFMQPLATFLGGLTLLLGVGGLIYRDLPPASQDMVERRLLGWLRRAGRSAPAVEGQFPSRQLPAKEWTEPAAIESPRRGRGKSPVRRPAAGDAATNRVSGDPDLL